MAFQQSPGIEIKEFDVSTYVPGVSSTEAAIGGVFAWGPVEAPELISSEAELVTRFGKPTDANFETFHIAANFLAYSDALYVSRAADANAYNASAGNGTITSVQIKNDTDFIVKQPTLSSNAYFFARYPSTLGNSLKVSQVDSADGYSKAITGGSQTLALQLVTNTSQAVLTITDTLGQNTAVSNAAIASIIADLNVGDFLFVSDPAVGSQYLKLSAIGSVGSVANGVSTSTLSFTNRFQLSANVSASAFRRYWEFYNVVDKAPGTTVFTAAHGGAGDEMHIVVVDEDGKFSGTPGTLLEVWSGVSRATDALSEQGGSLYYKDVINRSSRFIYAVNDRPGATSNTANNMTVVSTDPLSVSFANGTDSSPETSIPLSALARAYDRYKNADEFDVSLIISGKSVGGVAGEAISNYIVDNIASVRKDCVVTISPPFTSVVNNPYQEEDALLVFRNALRKSSYSFLTSAYKYQYDRYNDKYRWVAGCGDDAGLMARTDMDRDPWWSPAGHQRGVYKNIVKLAYNPDKSARDFLYKNDINPVVTMKGSGTILYGDKTLYGSPSAFDRINVRRLFIVIEKAIARASRDYLFEFNDEFTRARFRNMVEPYLRDVQGRRGINAFKVVCDSTNNTGAVIDRNEFVGSVLIKPNKSINFITLNFYALGQTVDFEYVISTFS